jgi:hypothetical protein
MRAKGIFETKLSHLPIFSTKVILEVTQSQGIDCQEEEIISDEPETLVQSIRHQGLDRRQQREGCATNAFVMAFMLNTALDANLFFWVASNSAILDSFCTNCHQVGGGKIYYADCHPRDFIAIDAFGDWNVIF